MAAPFQYLLNTFQVGALEKVSFSNTQNRKTVFKTLSADKKHYLLNRDNLPHPVKLQLSHKQKTFSSFFSLF